MTNPAVVGLVRTQLEALGWTDEDPVPPNLPQLFQSIKQSAVTDLQTRYDAASEADKPEILAQLRKIEDDSFFRVENLPPEFVVAAQQQLFLAIQEAKEVLEESQKMAEIDAKLPPQIQGEERAKILERLTNPEQKAEAEAETPIPAVITPEPTYCPCCSWNLKEKYEIEVTDADKEAYVAAVLGNGRFRKSYDLFGGRGSIAFRTLLVSEVDAIRFYLFEQAALGKITNDTVYIALWNSSKALLSLDSVHYDGKPTVYSSSYEGVARSKGDIAQAAGLAEHLHSLNEMVQQDTLRALVFAQFEKFEMLVEQLKIRANDLNFYSGI
jgi:hypothetical protein